VFLIVGLGNPGKDYLLTRHNIGFIFVDYLAAKYGFSFKGSKWQAETAKDRIWNQSVLLVKPQTYMNKSGMSVGQIANFYQIPNENIIVIHDDLDLALGRSKIVVNRGAGGHNGIRSLIEHLGGKDFARFRVGIGRPQHGQAVSKFVLSRFSDQEQLVIDEALQNIEEGVRLIVNEGILAAMNVINSDKD
jgi:PTH1 family peptidyl-tRNA hydrolase